MIFCTAEIANNPRSQLALKMSVTRSASARTLEWVEQAFEENERKELELEMEKRKEEQKENLRDREGTLNMELINSSDELKEVYAYYQVGNSDNFILYVNTVSGC